MPADPRRHTVAYCGEMIVSYSQNYEDVLFFRAFRGKTNGTFIDIGAGHPIADSVTCWLHTKNWRGINIEPNPEFFGYLQEYRSNDINLNIGVSDHEGSLKFYKVKQNALGHGWGLSSFDPSCQQLAQTYGFETCALQIPVVPLGKVVSDHGFWTPDLLKIDVEGLERAVLLSADWTNFAPRLICVEAVLPNSAEPAWPRWEDIIIEHDYVCALFDGVNCYYCKAGDMDLRGQLSAPVCCNDVFRRANEADHKVLYDAR